MNLIRDIENKKISFFENDKEVMSMHFVSDEFCWFIYSKTSLEITKETDLYFYNNLDFLMSNNYKFGYPDNLTFKTDNILQWYSDAYGDIEDEGQVALTSRLVIKRENGKFYISAHKPQYDKDNITKACLCVCFSPSGNGQYAKNIETNTNLQDDIVINVFTDTLNLQYTNDGKKQKTLLK